jgi:flagellar motor switch protein FliN/FliY
MEKQRSNKSARLFATALAEALSASLTEAVGAPWSLNVLDIPDLAMRHGKPIHFRLAVDGKLRGECFIECYEPHVADLGSRLLGQPAADFRDDHGEALEKVISSAVAGLTASLAAEHGEVTFTVDRVTDLAFGGMFVIPLAASTGQQSDIPVLLYFNSQLLQDLSSEPSPVDATEAVKSLIDPVNLKLVMDVELNVTLRFGQRQLPLREVLELVSGSVIELDRQVDEPVELLLDGKLIARGEAVIVDGNYGLRVTEIPRPIASHFTN